MKKSIQSIVDKGSINQLDAHQQNQIKGGSNSTGDASDDIVIIDVITP